MPDPNQHIVLDEAGSERIPDELLPVGVGPAWWTPEMTRTVATAHAQHKYDHAMEMKAWVVLHLMNERERLIEQLAVANELDEKHIAERDGLEEQNETLREALDRISRIDTRWAHMDSECQKIARDALEASSPASGPKP